ncbi:MAG TPA: hypothetical protein VF384_02835 [Planctomycetota bacterium]
MPRSCLLLAFALTAPLATAQVTATYDTFGAGCPGTGVGLGGRTLLPAAATTSWGSGNAIPLGWTPNRYQQVFSGSELPNAFTMAGLSLRQPHTGPVAHNFTVDVEITVGYTTRWGAGLSATFASNWDAGAPVTVLPRALVDLPDQPTPPPGQLDVLVTIPWTQPFAWVPQPGRNLLVEITVFGNSYGSGIYGYPIDNLGGTYSLYGTPASATVANSGLRGFGLVMGFDAQTHTAVPRLFSDDTPQIGNTFRVRVDQAAPSTVALLLFGFSSTWWSGIPLPLSLAPFGAPGCSLLVENAISSVVLTDGAGAANLQYWLPYDIYALGTSFYNQAFVWDPAANPFGLVASNAGHGVFGNQ